MPDYPYIELELTLLESSGPFCKVGEPRMVCQFKAVHLPGTQIDDARVCVVVRDRVTNAWREYTRQLTVEVSRDVAGRLRALDIPERRPDVKGVFDTSDYWTQLLLHIRAEQRTMSLDIDMASSGFDGQDAEPLRALFRELFAWAGYEGFCPVVYGPRRTG